MSLSPRMDLAMRDAIKRFCVVIGVIIVVMSGLVLGTQAVLSATGTHGVMVSGKSMSPTFHNRDFVLIHQTDAIRPGQIVTFHRPAGWEKYTNTSDDVLFIKRVLAVPGQTVSYVSRQRRFYVDGKPVATPHCEGGHDISHMLSVNEVFVGGDNTGNSVDSRYIFCQRGDNMFVSPDEIEVHGDDVFHV